jgi:hypothetical protein
VCSACEFARNCSTSTFQIEHRSATRVSWALRVAARHLQRINLEGCEQASDKHSMHCASGSAQKLQHINLKGTLALAVVHVVWFPLILNLVVMFGRLSVGLSVFFVCAFVRLLVFPQPQPKGSRFPLILNLVVMFGRFPSVCLSFLSVRSFVCLSFPSLSLKAQGSRPPPHAEGRRICYIRRRTSQTFPSALP